MKIILASASPRRAEILRQAGIAFTVLSSAVDETPLVHESPRALVQRLAAAKAELVAARSVGPAIVLAADTVVAIDNQILGKPASTEDARRMLQTLSGRSHSVLTGVSALRLPELHHRSFVEETTVHFETLSPEEISRYISTGEPNDKAGAYAIQGLGGRYIPRIEGDYYNVVGLPLSRVIRNLRELGWTDDPLKADFQTP